MPNTNEQIILKISTVDPQEYIESFRDAVLKTFMLLFERRELDLGEAQMYSLYRLAQAALAIQVQANTDTSDHIPKERTG